MVTVPQVFYVEMAKLARSMLLMQEECCSPFPFLIVICSYRNEALLSL